MSGQGDRPLVAIVTPVYNGERFLAETMECVQSLDYPRLVHVILDNASTDATPEIIKRYSNGRVPILVSRNASTIPMVANFNAAVAMVPEEAAYFRLLCADDTMSVDAISRKVEVAERDDAIGIVGCHCDDGHMLRGVSLPQNSQIFDGGEIIRSFFLREHDALHGTEVLIRRSKLDEQPIFYDAALNGAFDTDASIRISMTGKYGFVHMKLAASRSHDANAYKRFQQSKINLAEWLLLLDRHGPSVLGATEHKKHRTAFRRYYLRQLLLMRYRDGNKKLFSNHLDALRERNDPVVWSDFVSALAEWGFLTVTGQRQAIRKVQVW